MITKETCRNFRNDFNNTIKELEEKYKISIELGKISYDDAKFTAKITANVIGEEANEKEREEFEQYAKLYGFNPEDYGKEVVIQGKHFRFVGLNHRCPKNICKMAEISTGTGYKCPDTTMKNALAKAK